MKLPVVLFMFFISSIILIFVTVEEKSHIIYDAQLKKIKLSQIQVVSEKAYNRSRKEYILKRSFLLATKEIQNILLKESLLSKSKDEHSLLKIAKISNNVRENVVLSISSYTDEKDTAKDNLLLSQKRADELKEYFVKRTDLPLVVAIGYGKEFPLKKNSIEIKLKRIK